MLLDGERLRQLIETAKSEVVLCSPFIKADVLQRLLSVVASEISVRIITRWRPAEVAAGVSDLDVFEICQDRPRTYLSLLDNLHAKMYLADDAALIGSANLTATALGWVAQSNVELLVMARRADSEIANLLKQLERAEIATYAIKSRIEAEASKLTKLKLPEAEEVSELWKGKPVALWLPQCAAPVILYRVYLGEDNADIVVSTRDDALLDLSVLSPAVGLDAEQFKKEIAIVLERMPGMQRVINEVPRQLNDADGTALMAAIRPDLSNDEAATQWEIVRDWIQEFLSKKFEVAADSYVVRIRPAGQREP